MIKVFYGFLVLSIFISTTIHANKINESTIVVEKLNKKGQKVSPLFFGVNTLYWVDDDEARENKRYNNLLKELNFSIMRYPGGEIADNFNWKTNTLNNKNDFPYSLDINDSKTRMDFDEFVKWKNSFGAEAIIVVNIEQGFIEGDIEKAANFAAEWVRYANIEKKYNIKYWEIGNESYHLGSRYALKSTEYANALNIFSKKMKAIDPSIKIGAIGPTHKNLNPIIDVFSDKEVTELRLKKLRKSREIFAKRYKKKFLESKKILSWWEVVVSEVKDNFDFAVIHQYPNRKFFDKKLKLNNNLGELKRFFKKEPGRSIPFAITEYNLSLKKSVSDIDRVINISEMIFSYLDNGAYITNIWPILSKQKYGLLSLSYKKKPLYNLLKLFTNNIGNEIVEFKYENGMKILVSKDTFKNKISLFIINKQTEIQFINLKSKQPLWDISSLEINAKKTFLNKNSILEKGMSDEKYRFRISPLSITMIEFKIKGE